MEKKEMTPLEKEIDECIEIMKQKNALLSAQSREIEELKLKLSNTQILHDMVKEGSIKKGLIAFERGERIGELENEIEGIKRLKEPNEKDFSGDQWKENQAWQVYNKAIQQEKQINELRVKVGETLAIFHGDGGHYESKHGTLKALDDAVEKYYNLHSKVNELEFKNEEYTKQITDLKAEIESANLYAEEKAREAWDRACRKCYDFTEQDYLLHMPYQPK